MREALREKRLKLGYTQGKVAELAGISRVHYTNIEDGNKNPSLDVALRIKLVLKTKNDNIFLKNNVPEGNKRELTGTE